jgi:hypothetical protein
MDLVETGGFGASPIRTSVASFPAVFFPLMSLLRKNMNFNDVQ